jgi:hypothetical protein
MFPYFASSAHSADLRPGVVKTVDRRRRCCGEARGSRRTRTGSLFGLKAALCKPGGRLCPGSGTGRDQGSSANI